MDPVIERDVEKLKGSQEGKGFWMRRRTFLLVHWGKYPIKRLNCLSYCYTNVMTFGCEYPTELMDKLYEMAVEVASFIDQRDGNQRSSSFKEIWNEKISNTECVSGMDHQKAMETDSVTEWYIQDEVYPTEKNPKREGVDKLVHDDTAVQSPQQSGIHTNVLDSKENKPTSISLSKLHQVVLKSQSWYHSTNEKTKGREQTASDIPRKQEGSTNSDSLYRCKQGSKTGSDGKAKMSDSERHRNTRSQKERKRSSNRSRSDLNPNTLGEYGVGRERDNHHRNAHDSVPQDQRKLSQNRSGSLNSYIEYIGGLGRAQDNPHRNANDFVPQEKRKLSRKKRPGNLNSYIEYIGGLGRAQPQGKKQAIQRPGVDAFSSVKVKPREKCNQQVKLVDEEKLTGAQARFNKKNNSTNSLQRPKSTENSDLQGQMPQHSGQYRSVDYSVKQKQRSENVLISKSANKNTKGRGDPKEAAKESSWSTHGTCDSAVLKPSLDHNHNKTVPIQTSKSAVKLCTGQDIMFMDIANKFEMIDCNNNRSAGQRSVSYRSSASSNRKSSTSPEGQRSLFYRSSASSNHKSSTSPEGQRSLFYRSSASSNRKSSTSQEGQQSLMFYRSSHKAYSGNSSKGQRPMICDTFLSTADENNNRSVGQRSTYSTSQKYVDGNNNRTVSQRSTSVDKSLGIVDVNNRMEGHRSSYCTSTKLNRELGQTLSYSSSQNNVVSTKTGGQRSSYSTFQKCDGKSKSWAEDEGSISYTISPTEETMAQTSSQVKGRQKPRHKYFAYLSYTELHRRYRQGKKSSQKRSS